MSDTDLARVVDRVRTDLTERYGDLDLPISIQTGFWVRTHHPPG